MRFREIRRPADCEVGPCRDGPQPPAHAAAYRPTSCREAPMEDRRPYRRKIGLRYPGAVTPPLSATPRVR